MKRLTVSLTLLCLLVAGSAFAAAPDAKTTNNKPYKEKVDKKKPAKFDESDTNKDGVLSLEEFLASHPQGADIFAAMDADNDGKVTKDEMRAFFEARKEGKKKPRKFEQCDADGDGVVSREEFLACFPKGQDRFDAMDANKDGKLTKEEWRTYADARREEHRRAEFKRCDLNGDGMLSLEEFVQCKPAPKPLKGKDRPARAS